MNIILFINADSSSCPVAYLHYNVQLLNYLPQRISQDSCIICSTHNNSNVRPYGIDHAYGNIVN